MASKNNDVEKLDLGDVELKVELEKVKLKPKDVTVEDLSFIEEGNEPSSIDKVSSDEDSKKSEEPLESAPLENNNLSEYSSFDTNSSPVENISDNTNDVENIEDEDFNSDEEAENDSQLDENSESKEDENTNKEKNDSDDGKKTDNSQSEEKGKSDSSSEKDSLENSNRNNDSRDSNNGENNSRNSDSGNKNNDLEEKKVQKNDDPKDKKTDEKPSSSGQNDRKSSSNRPNKNKDSLKDRWNNRPKNPKEFANRAKDGIKKGAKNRFDNSKAGRAIDKGKKAVEKGKKAIEKGKKAIEGAKKAATAVKGAATAVKGIVSFLSTPAGWITLGVIVGLILILVIVIMVPSLFASGSPGVGGEVSDEENYSKYSETDQKTIDKLKDITEKYPNGDPSYAMAATLYPYIEEMQNGNVSSLRGKTNVEQEDDESVYDETDQDEDDEDIEDNPNDATSDDSYLELFRKRKYRKKFKKLLKKSESGEEALTSYLKDTWFGKDAGYKELFDGVSNTEELSDAIIDDLLSQKDDFDVYFYSNEVCSVNMTSIGTVEVDEMLKSNILVDVKVESCYTSKIDSCESMYSAPISMEKYIMGVTYEEIGASSSSDIEKVKAQMVAAKSYVIGRSSDMGWDIKKTDDGSYVIPIRANTNDQDYCDIDTGCQNKINGAKRGPIDAATRSILSEAWEASKNYYIYNEKEKKYVGRYCQNRTGVCGDCKKGTCMAHEELSDYKNTTFDKILGDQYSKYAFINLQGDYADASIASGETCAISGLGISDDQFIFYYQTDYSHIAFCGATSYVNSCNSGSNSICSSGCGVTSLAMLVANLSDNTSFDPIAANEEGKNNGGCAVGAGSYDSLFTQIGKKHDGFRYEKLANTKEGANNAIAALRDGALIAANVQANSPFTSGGHWILLRGVTEDGMVKVADPISKERSTTETYDINDFIDKNWLNGHSWFAIYGPKSETIKTANDSASEQGAAGNVIDTTKGIKGQFYAPIQKNLKMYGKNSANGNKNHDLGASCGTAVYSPMDGTATFKTITRNGKLASYGNVIEITTTDGYRFVLSHLKSFVGYNVKFGTGSTYPSSCSSGGCSTYTYGSREVKQGEKIGLSGTSGNSKGCHLHIEIWKGSTRLEPSTLLGYEVK